MQRQLSLYRYEESALDTALIVRVSSDINYSCFILSNGKQIIIAKTLKTFEHRLVAQQNFVRPSKGYIINTDFIKTYDQESRKLTLTDGYSVLVSRRRAKNIQATLNSFISTF